MKTNPHRTQDPDGVQETLCIGRHNISIADGLATITFCHSRNEPSALMDRGVVEQGSIVRARIVTTAAHLGELRKTIDEVLEKAALLSANTSGAIN